MIKEKARPVACKSMTLLVTHDTGFHMETKCNIDATTFKTTVIAMMMMMTLIPKLNYRLSTSYVNAANVGQVYAKEILNIAKIMAHLLATKQRPGVHSK